MYAIIQAGGKQYRVQPGDVVKLEKLPGEPGGTVSFTDVLLVGTDDTTTVGTPSVPKAVVTAEVVRQGRSPKVIVQKFKSKVRYRRKHGHRQAFTEVKITDIKA